MDIIREIWGRAFHRFTVGDGCWEWDNPSSNGYGYISFNSRSSMAHRLIYELLVGPIPPGLVLDHLCCNKRCVRPDHLDPVTYAVNSQRCPIMGRGSGSVWRAKTHCPKGHPYDDENTMWQKNGSRKCRECNKIWCRIGYYKRLGLEVPPDVPRPRFICEGCGEDCELAVGAHLDQRFCTKECWYAHYERVPSSVPLQTHCIHGHEFTPENTHVDSNGKRTCKECQRERQRLKRGYYNRHLDERPPEWLVAS